jgi:hypothetical protein
MIGIFALVTFRSFYNRLVAKIKRLRNPRYLIGAIAGGIYFYFVIFHRATGGRSGKVAALAGPAFSDLKVDAVGVVFLVLALLAWALPGDAGGLEFTESEIAFLFPAPLRRRDILLYKIVRSQPQIFLTALIGTLFGARGAWFVGIWAAATVGQLYITLATLGRARLRQAGVHFLVRLTAFVAIMALLLWYGRKFILPVLAGTSHDRSAFFGRLHEALTSGAAGVVLFLPRFIGKAIFPSSLAQLGLSLVVLAVVSIVFFLIAARLNVSFEEASIVTSQKKLERVARMQGSRRGKSVTFRRIPPPPLRATGPIEMAIIWKNVVALLRVSIGWVIVFLAIDLFLIGEAVFSGNSGAISGMGMAMGMLAAIFLMMGPALFANDLRLDFSRMEVLKSYPISGERLIAAEIAAPLVVVGAFEILFLAGAAILINIGGANNPKITLLASAQYVVIALLVAIPICALQLVIRNAVPVLFPAWAGRSKEDPRGIAFTGQRLVMLLGNLLVLGTALIPAALVLIPSLWLAAKLFSGHPAGIAVATMPAVFTLATEVWLMVKGLGAQFDRLDVSNELDIVEFA